jgi:parvulin-like peptidyl-prolyl isomerase
LYPAELWKLAKNLARDEVSFVVKTDAGYYVLVAHSMKKQGDLPELEYVQKEIRDRILIEQRRTRYNKLLAELKSKHSVEIRLGADTISQAMR